jgi:hypothetical protein
MGRASYCSRKLLVNASDHAWLNPKIFAHDAIKFACGDFELTLSENRRIEGLTPVLGFIPDSLPSPRFLRWPIQSSNPLTPA